jgi:hypothetical protein
MSRPSKSELEGLWEVDGSLRDLYVFDTSEEVWQRFLEFATEYPITYRYGGEQKALPQAGEIFGDRENGHLLAIQVGAVTANCHFFVESEIELDLDPKEITDEARHNQVLDFVENLARSIGKTVHLTPENSEETPFLSYEPNTTSWKIYA